MAADVHEAIYQYLIEVLGMPDTRDEVGLKLRYEDPQVGLGGLLYTHYLVVRDGLISRERWVDLNGKKEKTGQFETLDLCDPESLDFYAIRDLAQ